MTNKKEEKDGNEAIFLSLDERIRDFFQKTLGHSSLTAVQRCTIEYMLGNYDCVVQSPTGTGKTLAFVLPTMQLLVAKRKKQTKDCEILALILAPTRELVLQLGECLKPICASLSLNLLRIYGGSKLAEKAYQGQCVAVATPGRLEKVLESMPALKTYLKHLEVFIIDEADRFSDRESNKSVTAIMEALPKQRRTSLFSATQAREMEDLLRFSLMNPIRLNVTNKQATTATEGLTSTEAGDAQKTAAGDPTSSVSSSTAPTKKKKDKKAPEASSNKFSVAPKQLQNYFMPVKAEEKLLALVQFLQSSEASSAKVLCFMSNSASVEYFTLVLREILDPSSKTTVLGLHGKMKDKRKKILKQFRAASGGSKGGGIVLLSTDIMARGVDVTDIDWVVQFDLPRASKLFVHRIGRTGRFERAGRTLIFLTDSELAYADFIERHENTKLERYEFGTFSQQEENGASAAEALRKRVQELSIKDRKVLELCSKAFVSTIDAYTKHDCQIVCSLKDLDVVGLAGAFSCLRLPQMEELKGRNDLRRFVPRTDVRLSAIPYASNAEKEASRQELLIQRQKEAEEKRRKFQNAKTSGQSEGSQGKDRKRRKRQKSEWEELQEGQRLLKKFKKGKINRAELDEELDENF